MVNPMTEAQIAQFFQDGYTVVPDLFQPDELEPLRREIADIVDREAQRLQAEGRITDLREAEPFETRLTRLVADHPECWDDYRKAIEGKAGGGHCGPEMYSILTHARLLDAMQQLVGPEIVASSVYRIRPKVPGLQRGEIPWHQDSGYFAPHCDSNLIVTCWLPLVDATVENGCLEVLPGAHRAGVAQHHTGGRAGYLVIENGDLPLPEEEAIYVPVPMGGVLLMTNLTPHGSKTNNTDIVRWSVDMRYQGRDVPTNAFQEPEEFDPEAPVTEVACYAPEGDFLVRSARNAEAIPTWEEFASRRARYDAAGNLPYPKRGWQPV